MKLLTSPWFILIFLKNYREIFSCCFSHTQVTNWGITQEFRTQNSFEKASGEKEPKIAAKTN